jgi:hypothetical protein
MKMKSVWLKVIKLLCYLILVVLAAPNTHCQPTAKEYRLWYDKPVPVLPIINLASLNKESLVSASPVDKAWENWSLPIGNGYLGACIFGRTETERIQITENSVASKSLYGGVGLTNFAELYIDFGHANPVEYSRSLSLNDAVSTVKYKNEGVIYEREYFADYPDKVLVIKLKSNQKGQLSFTLRPQIPYEREQGEKSGFNGRTGKVTAKGDMIVLAGKLEYLNILLEGQFKVLPWGGSIKAMNDENEDSGRIVVSNADSAMILVAVGTNYKLDSRVFTTREYSKKLEGNPPPHDRVTEIMKIASGKSYEQLLKNHKKDYKELFDRVNLNLGSTVPAIPTDVLLKNYKEGLTDTYLEELYFQYGRYLLICSSRPGTLPPNLQGIWSQYDITPWTGGYWHNINIQMNYWPVFNTNLAELFQPFVDYNLAYRKAASNIATNYIKTYNLRKLSDLNGENGWIIGTGANAYSIGAPGGHSGPGTGGLTTKMFWDYYEFTADKNILKHITYPSILGMSQFLSKVVIDTLGLFLTSPSYSPEQRWKGNKHHYKTVGCAFDQQMIWENHSDVLKAAKILGDQNPVLPVLNSQLNKLEPLLIGRSGQVKEYR